MRKIYICCPFRGDRRKNLSIAREIIRLVLERGDIPLCAHTTVAGLYCAGATNQENELFDYFSSLFLNQADGLAVYSLNVSKRMRKEMAQAKSRGIDIYEIG